MSPGNYHYGAESKGQQQLAQEGPRVFPTASTRARVTVPPVGLSPGFTGLYLLDDEWRPPSRTAAADLTSKSAGDRSLLSISGLRSPYTSPLYPRLSAQNSYPTHGFPLNPLRSYNYVTLGPSAFRGCLAP